MADALPSYEDLNRETQDIDLSINIDNMLCSAVKCKKTAEKDTS